METERPITIVDDVVAEGLLGKDISDKPFTSGTRPWGIKGRTLNFRDTRGRCDTTANLTVMELLSMRIPAFSISIKAKSPVVSRLGIQHKVAVCRLGNRSYVVDQPQSELFSLRKVKIGKWFNVEDYIATAIHPDFSEFRTLLAAGFPYSVLWEGLTSSGIGPLLTDVVIDTSKSASFPVVTGMYKQYEVCIDTDYTSIRARVLNSIEAYCIEDYYVPRFIRLRPEVIKKLYGYLNRKVVASASKKLMEGPRILP